MTNQNNESQQNGTLKTEPVFVADPISGAIASLTSGAASNRESSRNRMPRTDRGPANRPSPSRRKKPRYQNRRELSRPIKSLPKITRERERESNAAVDSLKIIPLGGLGEVGRNMTIFEYKNDILLVDAGFGFPEDDMPGIDYTIPNIDYLDGKQNRIRGMFVTHGHMDHIGAIPYLIKRLGNPTIYTANLTKGIMLKRHVEFPHLPQLDIEIVEPREKVKLGEFVVEPFLINHTIPDDLALIISTPAGTVFHTSDYKIDPKPLNQEPVDLNELEKIGNQGITVLMADSTGAEKEGHSMSESVIQENLEKIFQEAEGRIIASTFSSLINRIQQLITLSEKYGRRVVLDGFSLKANVEIAKELKQISIKKETQIPISEIDKYPPQKITVIGTGAQGEGQAMLMRIASGEHRFITLRKGDSIVFSSSVIPGNERSVQKIKDLFYRIGARVYHYGMMDIHASGHGYKEELRKMIQLIRPKFLMPIHGQYSMMVNHKYIAQEEGMVEDDIIIADNGSVVHVAINDPENPGRGPSWWFDKKSVPADNVMVDGLGIGDIGNVVLRDRQVLAEDGMFVIVVLVDSRTGKVRTSPDIISRGFIYLKDNKDLLMQVRKQIRVIVEKRTHGPINANYIKDLLRDEVGLFLFQKTERRPMVLPVIIEV